MTSSENGIMVSVKPEFKFTQKQKRLFYMRSYVKGLKDNRELLYDFSRKLDTYGMLIAKLVQNLGTNEESEMLRRLDCIEREIDSDFQDLRLITANL